MSSLFEYMNSWWVTPKDNATKVTTSLITADDLLSVKLKPVSNVMRFPTRNIPTNFKLHQLDKEQLQSILSVKLKPTKPHSVKNVYEQRHPVLRELLEKRNTI